jgi:hypothetical protein
MSDAIFKPENIGDSVKSVRQVLTHKPLYAILRLHSMKNERNERLKAALIVAAILTTAALLGALEQAAGFLPNH